LDTHRTLAFIEGDFLKLSPKKGEAMALESATAVAPSAPADVAVVMIQKCITARLSYLNKLTDVKGEILASVKKSESEGQLAFEALQATLSSVNLEIEELGEKNRNDQQLVEAKTRKVFH